MGRALNASRNFRVSSPAGFLTFLPLSRSLGSFLFSDELCFLERGNSRGNSALSGFHASLSSDYKPLFKEKATHLSSMNTKTFKSTELKE